MPVHQIPDSCVFTLSVLEDRILHVQVKEISEMTLQDVIQLDDEIERVANGKKVGNRHYF